MKKNTTSTFLTLPLASLSLSLSLSLSPCIVHGYAAENNTMPQVQTTEERSTERSSTQTTIKKIPITFTGCDHVSSNDLRRAAIGELQAYAQHRREADLFDASFNMLQYLRNIGYYFARVEYVMLPDHTNPHSIVFKVHEEQQVTIKEIIAVGADSWAKWHDQDISHTIGSPIKGFFKHFGVGDLIFRQNDIDNALNTITTSYLLHGYQKAQVTLDHLEWSADKKHVTIHVAIKEGPQYRFRDVSYHTTRTNSNISEKELHTIITGKKIAHSAFHPRFLQSQAARIRRQLFTRGYLAATVSAQYSFETDTLVDAKIEIVPGPQYIFSDLIINGNTHTRRGVFEFYTHLIHKGAPLYYSQIERSMSYLYKMGVFKKVSWDKLIKSYGDGVVHADLFIEVEELAKTYLDLSLGYGSYEQFRAGISHHDRNVFGLGIEGDIGAAISLKSKRIESNLFWGGYYRRRFFSMHGSGEIRDEPSFTSEIVDARIRYREQFAMFEEKGPPDPYGIHRSIELWESQVSYGVELSDAKDIQAGTSPNEESLFLSSFTWALIYDSRNNTFNPSSGMRLSGSAEWSHKLIGSDIDFVLYESSLKNHFTLNSAKTTILATHMRINTYDLRGNETGMPIQKRLFLGGENTVRSFNRHDLGPFDAEGDPLGGLSTALLSIELRFPLFPTYNLSGAVFYDAGLVDEEELSFDAEIGQGVGVGLRFDLPIGPIRLDVAQNIGETFASGDDIVIHFGLGFSF